MTTGMSGTPPSGPRVVVGVADSRAARWALAWAIGEARLRHMPLLIVHIEPFPAPALQIAGECGGTAREVRAIGAELIKSILTDVAGGTPAGVEVFTAALLGDPGDLLVGATGESDILVIGRGSRRTGRSLLRAPSVGTHCARHTRGTLICVRPPSEMRLPGEPTHDRSPLRRWLGLRRRTGANRMQDG